MQESLGWYRSCAYLAVPSLSETLHCPLYLPYMYYVAISLTVLWSVGSARNESAAWLEIRQLSPGYGVTVFSTSFYFLLSRLLSLFNVSNYGVEDSTSSWRLSDESSLGEMVKIPKRFNGAYY